MKTQHKRTVLAVDDDDVNLMIILKGAQEAGYAVKPFASSKAAWDFLKEHPDSVDIALLDKMMPDMDGVELLKQIKGNKSLKHIPVIIQTGDVGIDQMRDGLESGAYYYLTKPFHPEILKAILHSADSECAIREEMLGQMTGNYAKFIGLLREGEFTVRTHAQARLFAAAISLAAPNPELVAIGLLELLSNAIEHGNLEIGAEAKSRLLMNHKWDHEVADRLASPQYLNRLVRVHVNLTYTGLHVAISDEGRGFDWERYMYSDVQSTRLNEPNGRGIAKAVAMLDDVRYTGRGNEVHCTVTLPPGYRHPRHSDH